MATVRVSPTTATIELSAAEKLWCLRGDLELDRALVRDVRVSEHPFDELRGIRAPGLGLPGRVAIGRWRGREGQDLVVLRRGQRALVLELEAGAPFRRVIIGMQDPVAAAEQFESHARPVA